MIEAQLAFGDVYLAGRGTSRDDAEARRWSTPHPLGDNARDGIGRAAGGERHHQ